MSLLQFFKRKKPEPKTYFFAFQTKEVCSGIIVLVASAVLQVEPEVPGEDAYWKAVALAATCSAQKFPGKEHEVVLTALSLL